ncbi:MAG: cytochrome c biogenesis protein CcdA [Actinobacteria bacterium]|nr:cytochrome c biogenesis protein CcdA [Actinomycetota bacterium]
MSPLLPLLAVAAGFLSFTSPCVLPLLPSYISYVSGLPSADLERGAARSIALRSSLGFVVGFTIVFSALGASSTLVGSFLVSHLPIIVRVAGVVIIVMGLASAGLLSLPVLSRERRFDLSRVRPGPRGAVPLGMAFAFGWTPCIGPVLATVLAVASTSSTVAWGTVLLMLYSLGLGVPFVLLAVGFSHAKGSLGWLHRHSHAIEVVGGLLLVAVGAAFVTGAWRTLFVPLQAQFAKLGWPPL